MNGLGRAGGAAGGPAHGADRPAHAGAGPAAPGAGPSDIRSVYVHAPFCARRCGYCDFAVKVRRKGDPDAWAAAVAGELGALAREGTFRLADELDTLYVGGGTPSLLGPEAMARLSGVIGRERLARADLEWTAEANPESFTDEVAAGWSRAGVNRISLGVQTFDERALRWMGRLHGAEGAGDAVRRARAAGIEDFSVDLIFALPDGVRRSWTEDLARALALEPAHLSLYGLTVEPGTPLGRRVSEGRDAPVDEGRYREEYLEAAETLSRAGYLHYEVSNFARPGRRSRHNGVYWSGDPYLGLGNSAHSYLHPLRRWNLREWDAYEGVAREGRVPVLDEELLDERQTRLERVWLGLRTDGGVPVSALTPRGLELVRAWAARGWAAPPEGAVRLTPEGWLLLDRLAVELDSALDGDAGTSWKSRTTRTEPART